MDAQDRVLRGSDHVNPKLLDIGSREYPTACQWLKEHGRANTRCNAEAGIFIGLDHGGQYAYAWCPACGRQGPSIPMRSAGV